ncbi:putative Antibiotic biosynthesis monooxygenase [Candidatus Sulfobium mesophilum]|uniref:Putative Antibiotic biosynthesis monooxygenase n=1 Tax=Candidatus Sulfobium mesophilum TaxID=2016548 RepID=A0A2U3QF75_9BACT|nr:putative Antibiotic biosynthesis monooxygenase [Candidatus Sulfobium mesophilum]
MPDDSEPMSGYNGGYVDTKILVTLNMIVRPERRSDLLGAMRGILEPSRVERGCLSYRLYQEVQDENAFVLLEEWKTQKDLESHIRTDNQRQLLAIMDLLSEQYEVKFNTVSHTSGMELIENVLKRVGPR